MTVTIWLTFTVLCCSFVGAIRIERVNVPSTVVTGTTTELQCVYKEEDDELYTLKWWRGADQFYQYVPPRRNFFPTPGVRVDMNATTHANRNSPIGLERVILKTVGLDSSGVYKCEVMADRIFETVSMESNMTVVYPPSGPPSIYGMNDQGEKVRNGQNIVLKCSVPPAIPPPIISWRINGRQADPEWVKTMSQLEFVVDHKIIGESFGGLEIECEAQQKESKYRQSDQIVLIPENTSYFWFLGSGTTSISAPWKSWADIVMLISPYCPLIRHILHIKPQV